MADTAYEYRPLPLGSTRLLRLESRTSAGGGICCSLLDRPLFYPEDEDFAALSIPHDPHDPTEPSDEHIYRPYEALSYCWGDEAVKHTIWCEGKQMRIRKNLYQALLRLRTQISADHDGRLLWVDAVCINQVDVVERSQQVALMRHIFASANRVVVWLGEDSPLQHGLRSMKFFDLGTDRLRARGHGGDRISAFDTRELNDQETWFAEPEQAFERMASVMRERIDTLDDVSWEIFRAKPRRPQPELIGFGNDFLGDCPYELQWFFQRPWFNRRWIIQELFAAHAVTVICGVNSTSWENVHLVAATFFGMRDSGHRPYGKIIESLPAEAFIRNAAPLLMLGEESTRSGSRSPDLQCLEAFRNFECADDRDRIFALMGLNSHRDGTRIEMAPDYGYSVEEIYHMFAIACVKGGHTGMLLKSAARRTKYVVKTQGARLPSWVPDWRVRTTLVPRLDHSQSVNAPLEEPLPAEVVEDGACVLTEGRVVDAVFKVEQDSPNPRLRQFTTLSGGLGQIHEDWAERSQSRSSKNSILKAGDIVVEFHSLHWIRPAVVSEPSRFSLAFRAIPQEELPAPAAPVRIRLIGYVDLESATNGNANFKIAPALDTSDMIMSGLMDFESPEQTSRAFYESNGVPVSRRKVCKLLIA